MKVLRSILRWISLALLVVGGVMMALAVMNNKSFLTYLSNMIENNEAFGKSVRMCLIGAGLVFAALIIFILSMKLSSRIRAKERELKKQREEEERQAQIEREKKNREEIAAAQREAVEKAQREAQEAAKQQ